MALSPEDVLNKTFTTTQFRRGYDEREVDDFLDDIVVEMRRAAKEGDELRNQLNDCREGHGLEPAAGRIGEVQPGDATRHQVERGAFLVDRFGRSMLAGSGFSICCSLRTCW